MDEPRSVPRRNFRRAGRSAGILAQWSASAPAKEIRMLLPALNVHETGNSANLRSCGVSIGIACASARSHEWNDQDVR
jgi:hypothetical protein